jgi:hypothetical protein
MFTITQKQEFLFFTWRSALNGILDLADSCVAAGGLNLW